MLSKILRIFAATLIFSSSISFATGGETGENQDSQDVPKEGSKDPSALIIANMHMEPQQVTLPNGTVVTRRSDIMATSATTPEELGRLNELESKIVTEAKSRGEIVATVFADADAEVEKGVADHAIQVAEEGEVKVRIPESWKEYRKFYWEDFVGAAKNHFRMKGRNRTLTVMRMTLNFGVPFVLAVYFSGSANIPWFEALPGAAAYSSASGILSGNATLLPWNRMTPNKTERQLLVKFGVYYVVESLFAEFGRWAMNLGNYVAISYGLQPGIHLSTQKNLLLLAALFGSLSQGLFAIGATEQMKKFVSSLQVYAKTFPKEFEVAQKRALNKFYTIDFMASIVSVGILASQTASHTFANISLGIFTGGALYFLSHILRWDKAAAEALGIPVKGEVPEPFDDPTKFPDIKLSPLEKFIDRCSAIASKFRPRSSSR